jgi:predicted transcriptional regulator
MTYSHIRNIYIRFHNRGIVHVEKIGRRCKIKLTEKGKKLKRLLIEIEKELCGVDALPEKIAGK